jgi:hypothetical protein
LRLHPAIIWVLCIAAIVSVGSDLAAQDLFDRNKLPFDWMSPPILKQRLSALAGESAIICGRASRSSLAPADVTDCALEEYVSKKKFYARYDVQGIDSELAVGFAFDGKRVYAVTWERMIGWGDKQTLHVEECPSPIKLVKTKSGRLNCFPPDPKAKTNILSPELEPY